MSKNRRAVAAGFFAAACVCLSGVAFAADCRVADPTGTPLNLRSEPNGKILAKLDNGLAVEIVDERVLGGKRWAKIASYGKTLGWVFAAYIDCQGNDDALKSAPMRPRAAPQ